MYQVQDRKFFLYEASVHLDELLVLFRIDNHALKISLDALKRCENEQNVNGDVSNLESNSPPVDTSC